jgi:O-antigen/teichoic acid export membrane protein
MTGSIVAQLIPIALTPVLTRLYSPEDFGAYGLLFALMVVLSIVATGRYETAAFIPKRIKTVESIIYLGLGLATIFSLLLLLFIQIESNWILSLVKIKDANQLYFVPIGVLIISYYSVLRVWLNRLEHYKVIRQNTIIQSSAVGFTQIAIGLSKIMISHGLILGDLTGKLLTTVKILILFYRKSNRLKIKNVFFVLRRFHTIPKFQMPAALINNAAMYAPSLILPMLFSQTISGFYFLVYRIVMLPISIISNSMLEVFRAECAKNIQKKGQCSKCFEKNCYGLVIVAVPIYLVLLFFGSYIFTHVFGSEWQEAGHYAQILAPLAAIRLVAAPLSYVFILREKHSLNFIFQLCFLAIVVLALYGGFFYKNAELFVYLISYLGSIFYLLQIFFSYRLAK